MGVLPGLSAMFKWLIAGKGPLGGLTIPGGAFIRTDDPKCVPSPNLTLYPLYTLINLSSYLIPKLV